MNAEKSPNAEVRNEDAEPARDRARTDISTTPEWEAVGGLVDSLAETSLRGLFAGDPGRAERMTTNACDLHADWSKNIVTSEIVDALFALAERAGVEAQRDAMFAGEHINTTEDRSVLHTALRVPEGASLEVDGTDVAEQVHAELRSMREFAEKIRSGEWTGHTGKRIDTVVGIGIGGSDLGPVMVDKALRHYQAAGIRALYVSNVDPADLSAVLAEIDPETTLVVVASKTFSTQETLANARAARRHFVEALGDEAAVASHFVAVSTAAEKVADFGIDQGAMFGFWDWVGGRYSVDSAIGLTCMITAGPDAFDEFLSGFHAMDEHFRSAPARENLPVIMGLLSVWYSDFLGAQSTAVIPYAEDLGRFPAYLQQLTMESLGKSVRKDGADVSYPTGLVWWGEPGTNGQHAFFQLLHQGTQLVPVDFLGFAEPLDDIAAIDPSGEERGSMHDLLMSNFFAQSRVLAFGRTKDEILAEGVSPELAPHKVMPGNRPSTSILAPRLTPSVLGQLIALYEHSVFVQAAVWGINAFDQWGVELGKKQAGELLPFLTAEAGSPEARPDFDGSTDALIRAYREMRGRG